MFVLTKNPGNPKSFISQLLIYVSIHFHFLITVITKIIPINLQRKLWCVGKLKTENAFYWEAKENVKVSYLKRFCTICLQINVENFHDNFYWEIEVKKYRTKCAEYNWNISYNDLHCFLKRVHYFKICMTVTLYS